VEAFQRKCWIECTTENRGLGVGFAKLLGWRSKKQEPPTERSGALWGRACLDYLLGGILPGARHLLFAI
jgi:hypothetical protein